MAVVVVVVVVVFLIISSCSLLLLLLLLSCSNSNISTLPSTVTKTMKGIVPAVNGARVSDRTRLS